MSSGPGLPGRLDSWKEIAAYVGRNVRTVIRWEHQRGFPVHRIPGVNRSAVFAFSDEIDRWLDSGTASTQDAEDPDPEKTKEVSLATLETLDTATGKSQSAIPVRRKLALRWLLLGGVGLLSTAAMPWAFRSLRTIEAPQFTDLVQLTEDRIPKEGLVTDGQQIYFSELEAGREVLATISAQGGRIRELPTPPGHSIPEAISRDGRQLLVLSRDGEQYERNLWVVSNDGSQAFPVDGLQCHAATWSPDGRWIAYALGNSLYLTDPRGRSRKLLSSFSGIPEHLLWSKDGNNIRVSVRMTDLSFSIWDLRIEPSNGYVVSSMKRIVSDLQNVWSGAFTLDRLGGFFVRNGPTGLEKVRWISTNSAINGRYAREKTAFLEAPSDIAMDPRSDRLFVLARSAAAMSANTTERSILFSSPPGSNDFHPYLPGNSVTDLAFSRDGRRAVYVTGPDRVLYVGSPDLRSVRRIPFPTANVELPRWSPDGSRIAFMGKLATEPWSVFVVSKDGTGLHKVSLGEDSKGAPTWSPDSRELVYGNVNCQELQNCSIHRLDLKTAKESIIPGSEGLTTARWSPDGRFIAALRIQTEQVFIYSLSDTKWRKLADNINGNDLEWSADSKALYCIRPSGEHPQILRIPIDGGGSAVLAVDLTGFGRMTGGIDTWFTISPKGEIVFRQSQEGTAIYALEFRAR